MVVFTCNHCGESLQKPRVEKHYNIQCRRPKSLTCVDCFTDFKNEEYTVHTKCITEEERYSAKGSIPGGVVKKGEVKQESWTGMIRSIVETEQNMKASLKNLFETISNYSNVPRKKAKFINFLKSSTGGRVNFSDIEAAWDLIEKFKNEQKKDNNLQNAEKVEETTEGGVKQDIVEAKENGTKHTIGENGEEPVKKKKKVKQEPQVGVEAKEEIQHNGFEHEVDNDEAPPKKKKKVKTELQVETSGTENIIKHEIEDNGEAPAKKKKKVKHDSEVKIEEKEEIQQNGLEHKIDNDKVSLKKKKKVKGELQVETEAMENGTKHEIEDNGEAPAKKKKKVKGELQIESKATENGTKHEIKDNGEAPAKKKKKVKEEPQVETEATENGTTKHKIEDSGEAPAKKKKKVKNDLEVEIEGNEEIKENGMIPKNDVSAKKKKKGKEEPQGDPEVKNEPNEFSFKETILNIIKSKGAISANKLQKKVLAAYLKETGNTEYTGKTIKKYNQKLKKLPTVTIQDDIVSLVVKSEQ